MEKLKEAKRLDSILRLYILHGTPLLKQEQAKDIKKSDAKFLQHKGFLEFNTDVSITGNHPFTITEVGKRFIEIDGGFTAKVYCEIIKTAIIVTTLIISVLGLSFQLFQFFS